MFANSSSVVSIHCVARGLGASFLYKCSASRDGFLRQHGLLVLNVADEVCLCSDITTIFRLTREATLAY